MKFRNFNHYEILPEEGRIFSYWSNKYLSTYPNKKGYVKIRLYDDNSQPHHFKAHNVIWETYHQMEIPADGVIHHKNHIGSDNRISNLVLLHIDEHSNYHILFNETNPANAKKPIEQYDLQGNLIKVWDSIHQINRELGYNRSGITNCCQKKYKTCRGYIWKYAV